MFDRNRARTLVSDLATRLLPRTQTVQFSHKITVSWRISMHALAVKLLNGPTPIRARRSFGGMSFRFPPEYCTKLSDVM
jgi:hypothetical protein